VISKIKQSVLGKIINFRLRVLSKQDRAYDFSEQLAKTEKILIIIPAGDEYSESIQNFTQKIGMLFKKARVSTFVNSSLRKNDLNWLGVPNEKYLRIIRDEQFDLVVDINTKQDTISSYLCALSGAPMRINLTSSEFDHLYNLHFRVKDVRKSTDEQLQNILSYLKFLIDSKSVKA
jgi:hypothetical protein